MTANRHINLYSDTQTLPSIAMRKAMAEAPVGDEQRGEDPSVNALCERVADWLGKERAVFLPSGTMCNEIAIRVHCRPGDEVIAESNAHIIHFEGGGPAALSGVMIRAVEGERGIYSPQAVRAALRNPADRYSPNSRLLAVEQTANMAGGTVWPVAALVDVTDVAREAGLSTHMDGARLPNAAVALGIEPKTIAQGFDTVWIDLSKGLGCPVGAVLAGSEALIEEVWRWKQRIGGAMRQAGILAAAGLYALDHNVARLADDHSNARSLAEGIAALPGIECEPAEVETNMVFFQVTGRLDAPSLSAVLRGEGIVIGALDDRRMRAVTHLDVGVDDIATAVAAMTELLAN